jgi:hypothetical protein
MKKLMEIMNDFSTIERLKGCSKKGINILRSFLIFMEIVFCIAIGFIIYNFKTELTFALVIAILGFLYTLICIIQYTYIIKNWEDIYNSNK